MSPEYLDAKSCEQNIVDGTALKPACGVFGVVENSAKKQLPSSLDK